MGAHAVSNYCILSGTCIFLNVLISSVIGQMQIPEWDNPPKVVMLSEDKPVGTVIGSLKLKNGDGLMITSESTFVNVTNPQSGPGYITVDIVLNTKLDYDSGVSQLNCIFKGINKDVPAGIQLEVKVIVTNVNDEPPYLENQPYSISVAEDASIGSLIYQFTSKDLDPGDPPTFSLTAHAQSVDDDYKNKFAVNSATGQLTLMGKLDFETVRFYEYTIIVKDQVGHNNTAQVFITITDVQDTPPFFTGEPFQTKMDESTPVNTDLIHVIATDGDRGVPNDIMFSINGGSCGDLFEIDSKSGWISLKSQADRDTGLVSGNNGVCGLGVGATEDNQHPQSPGSVYRALTFVTITVLDINDNAPTFSNTAYTFHVDENTPAGVVINTQTPIRVSDADQGSNAYIDVAVNNFQDNFEAVPSRVIGSGEVFIRVKNPAILDYELYHSVHLEVEARDAAFTSTSTVVIELNNINDNSPRFTVSSLSLIVSEATPVGNIIAKLDVYDIDENDTVSCYIENFDSPFNISHTGLLTLSRSLDRETKDVYHLTVITEDESHNQGRTVVSVSVADVNDNAPKFDVDLIQTSLAELSTSFRQPITVHATDFDQPNTSNSEILYSINSSVPADLNSHFNLDSKSGVLTVRSSLEYDKITFPPGEEGWITLIIEAKDQGKPALSSTASVRIYLQETINTRPICNQTMVTTSQPEVTPSIVTGHTVPVWSNSNAPFIAVDETTPVGSVIGSLRLENGNGLRITSETSYVSISVTKRGTDFIEADIILLIKLDYDHGRKQVTLLFTGSSDDFPEGTEFRMSLLVKDVNDEAPVFQNRPYSVSVPENEVVNIEVYTQIKALDSDVDDDLTYTLIALDAEHSNIFAVDSSSGALTLMRSLDFETTTFYHFKVKVQDTASHTDSADVFITVLDAQDMPPFFTWLSPSATISVNDPVGTQVMTVTAEDGDRGLSNDVLLSILSESCLGLVWIDPKSGVVILARHPVGSEYPGTCSFIILATEDGPHPQVQGNSTATTTARIHVSV